MLAPLLGETAPASAGETLAQGPAVTPSGGDRRGMNILGTVTSTVDALNYTYVEVDTGAKRIWAAGPQTPVQLGDSVFLLDAMPMTGFHSKSLDRKFETLYFVSAIRPASHANGVGAGAAAPHGEAPTATVKPDVSGIARAEGGHTIAEIFDGRERLVGQEVAVRGVVVKINSRILGRNWIHLEDGTAGPDGSKVLVATSQQTAEVGDTVLVRGTLATDKDLGYGYHYDALVEEATVTAE
jgi:hypothetical protein